MEDAYRCGGDDCRPDVPGVGLLPRHSGHQLAELVLQVESEHRHRTVEENEKRNERQRIGQHQPRPPERLHEWRQQQYRRQLQRHRGESDGAVIDSLEHSDTAPLADRIRDDRARARRRKVMERIEHRPHVRRPRRDIGGVDGHSAIREPALAADRHSSKRLEVRIEV